MENEVDVHGKLLLLVLKARQEKIIADNLESDDFWPLLGGDSEVVWDEYGQHPTPEEVIVNDSVEIIWKLTKMFTIILLLHYFMCSTTESRSQGAFGESSKL
jgi:hypothetical protein